MKVYYFGNPDVAGDNVPYTVVARVGPLFPNITFVEVKPNEDLPFENMENVVLLDTVEGINSVKLIEGAQLDNIKLSPRTSVHDFDLAFQLKYLKKLGKLGEVKIIGLPAGKEFDYDSIQSIFKKLVAQDIQGS